MIIVWLIILTVFVAWCVWGVIENTQTLLTMLRMTNELNKLERENIEMQKELERWVIANDKGSSRENSKRNYRQNRM